ncbi:MAG: COR domain-containing protein [Saprospiraceae bacterium]
MSDLAKKLIEKEKKERTGKLDLGHCGLTDLEKEVPELFELVWLEELVLGNYWYVWLEEKKYWESNKSLIEGKQNQIRDIPRGIANFPRLEKLVLSGNKISKLKNLPSCLTILNVGNNEISKIENLPSGLSIFEITGNKITKLENLPNGLKVLNLGGNQIRKLENIPPTINTLYIGGNKLTEIENLPKGLATLYINNSITVKHEQEPVITVKNNNKVKKLENLPDNLTTLLVAGNQIEKLENLPVNLTTFDISHNRVEKLDDLPWNLFSLDISYNPIQNLSPALNILKKGIPISLFWGTRSRVCVEGCPLVTPPIEIVKQGNEAILNYFRQLEEEGQEDYLFETKLLIIGEAGAGKTTFAKRIQQANAAMPGEGDSTHGINVDRWEFEVPAGTFKEINHRDASFHVNLWDFGGQEVYHGTHQFFFSKKSLYVLLCDTREQKTDFRYWLNTVEQLCGEDAHLFILFNRREEHDWQLDAGFRERFKQLIKEEYSLDLSIVESIPELQRRIKSHLQKLPDVGQKLIQSWVDIREDLAKETANNISFDRFKEICAAHNRTRPEDIENISRYFTRIGVFTHYMDDLVLRERVYLNSNHLVKTIYQLLDNAEIKAFDGRIGKGSIEQVWKKLGFEKERLPRLLEKFGLMYEVPKQDKYIIPEHLPDGAPYVHWSHEEIQPQLHFRYEFDKYMPKGLMSRLIVALHHYIGDHSLVWRRGVNLSHGGAYSEITESLGGVNRFDIRIVGDFRRDLLVIITQAFDHILSDFQKLPVSREVRCPCAECVNDKEPYFHKMEKIENAILKYEKSDLKVTCDKSYETIHVTELLGMVNYKWVLNQVKEKDEHGRIYSKVTELLDVVEKKVVPKINKINKSVEKLHEKFDALYDSLIAEIDQSKGDFFDSKNEILYFEKRKINFRK